MIASLRFLHVITIAQVGLDALTYTETYYTEMPNSEKNMYVHHIINICSVGTDLATFCGARESVHLKIRRLFNG